MSGSIGQRTVRPRTVVGTWLRRRGRRLLDARRARLRRSAYDPIEPDGLVDGRDVVGPAGRLVSAAPRHIARLLLMFEAGSPAMRWAAWAARLDSTRAEHWRILGDAFRAAGDVGPRLEPGVGVALTHLGDAQRAEAAYRIALRQGRDAGVDAWIGLTDTELAQGRFDAAIGSAKQATDRYPSDSRAWYDLGRAIAERGLVRGGLDRHDVAAIDRAWLRSVRASTGPHTPARYRLLRHRIRYRNWDAAFSFVGHSTAEAPDCGSIGRLARATPTFEPRDPEWWFCATWRLQQCGCHGDAWQARKRWAEHLLVDVDWRTATESSVRTQLHARVVLDDLPGASELVERASQVLGPRPQVIKWRADLALRRGDPEPLLRWASERDTGLARSPEDRFSALVTGRTVAVLGPHAWPADGPELAADVALVTKATHRERNDTMPLVSYYSDSSAAMHREAIEGMLEQGGVDQAVFRPTLLSTPTPLTRHPGARVMAAEDSLCATSHFGIGRIVYDVLRYHPASVRVCSVDLFTRPDAYPPGYLADVSRYDAAGMVPVLPRFDHDLFDDFHFLRALRASELIDVDDTLAELLALDITGYLERVDRAHSGDGVPG